jgi:putative sterol carrier protein
VRFDLADGERTDHWLVTVVRGEASVSREGADADCVIRAGKELFDRMASGEANAMAAILRGELAVEGDLGLLILFQRLLPGPPSSSHPRHSTGAPRPE